MKKLFPFVIVILLNGCAGTRQIKTAAGSLKDTYKKDFLIGAAISWRQVEEKDPVARELVPRQFNTVTPENLMKEMELTSAWGTYDFSRADRFVDFAKANHLQVNGHTLVWHSQMPDFARRIQSADSFRTFFTDHIRKVAGHYSGKVQSWDVVNEALNEDGTLRSSPFLNKLGANYIVDAFKLTQEVAPNTALYYNDYNNEQPKKRAGCMALIKKIQQAGVRIDGVGIQGHWHVGKLPFKDIEESILQYAALGIKVAITELDIEVLPRNFTGADVSRRMNVGAGSDPYANGLPETVQKQLADDYGQLFALLLRHKDKISRVTFWGVHDGQSWLNNWPIAGRTSYPLLFDRKGNPKSAFYSVIKAKKK
ncbi:MAG: endo-1,4-beta-xylanase [Niabella sp.]|nr:endo-1,4-beta-xylanase [Niabella sp.]